MSEIKLLPCPFCGGEAHIEEHKFWDEKAKGFTVQTYGVVCDNCCSMSWRHHRHKEKAIEQWNTRKPMERILTRLCEKQSEFRQARHSLSLAMYTDEKAYNKARILTQKELVINEAKQIVKEEGGIE